MLKMIKIMSETHMSTPSVPCGLCSPHHHLCVQQARRANTAAQRPDRPSLLSRLLSAVSPLRNGTSVLPDAQAQTLTITSDFSLSHPTCTQSTVLVSCTFQVYMEHSLTLLILPLGSSNILPYRTEQSCVWKSQSAESVQR